MITIEKPNVDSIKKYEFANCSERILVANAKIKKALKESQVKCKNDCVAASNFRPI